MAFGARTARGSGNERTSDTSLVSAINGTVAVDSILFALFLTDNLQTTDGTSNNHSSVADTTGANTWTKLLEETETDGAAADGLCFSLWFTKVASQLTTSDTVTLTISANVTSKAARLVMTTVDAGNTVALQQVGFGHAASSASVSSMPSQEYLLLGIHCGENEDIAITVDADYTENGTPARSSTSGVEESNVTLHVAERVATLTGDTYTITGAGINNLLTVLAAIKEQASGGATHEGTGSSSVVVTTSATGKRIRLGTGSSSVVVSASATGLHTGVRTGSSSVVVTTTATGQPTHKATGSSSVVITLAASGEVPGAGGDLPTVVGVGTYAESAADVVPGLPSGWAPGDIHLLFVHQSGVNDFVWTPPTGWDIVPGSQLRPGTVATDEGITVLWRRAQTGDTDPTVPDTINHTGARILGIRGAISTGDPWDVLSANTDATVDTDAAIPGATTTVANCLVVVYCNHGVDGVAGVEQFSGWTNSDLASITEQIDNSSNFGNGGGIGVVTGEKASAGAYGDTTVTLANASSKAFGTIAIQPEGGVPSHEGTGSSSIVVTTTGTGAIEGAGAFSSAFSSAYDGGADSGAQTGTGSSSVVVTTSGTGLHTGVRTGSSSVVVTTSGTGKPTHKATGSSSVVVSAAATGKPTHKATGSSSVVVTTSATGLHTGVRTGSSSVVVTTTGSGNVQGVNEGTGTSSIVVSTTATGRATHFATGASNVVVSASGTGLHTGVRSGSSSVVVTTTASGLHTGVRTGVSNVVVTTTGFGVAEGNNQGAGSSSVVVSATATGKPTHKATGSCSVVVSASATAVRRAHRTGSSSVVVTCSATGAIGARQGQGSSLIVVSAAGAGESDITTTPHWPVSTQNGWGATEGEGWPVSTNPEWEVV